MRRLVLLVVSLIVVGLSLAMIFLPDIGWGIRVENGLAVFGDNWGVRTSETVEGKINLVDAVFVGFEKGNEKIGEYEYLGKAVYVTKGRGVGMVYLKTPIAIRVGNLYFYQGQIVDAAEYGGENSQYGVVNAVERRLRVGGGGYFQFPVDLRRWYEGISRNVGDVDKEPMKLVFQAVSVYQSKYRDDWEKLVLGKVKRFETINMLPPGQITLVNKMEVDGGALKGGRYSDSVRKTYPGWAK